MRKTHPKLPPERISKLSQLAKKIDCEEGDAIRTKGRAVFDILADVRQLKAEPKQLGFLHIDTAKVEFAFSKGLHSCDKFFSDILEQTCYTATVAYCREKGIGAFRTLGNCDGQYLVRVYRGGFFSLPDKIQGACVGEIRIPDGAKCLNMGDCGKVQIRIPLREGDRVVRFWWEKRSNALWITI